jgi:hypothetical protein
LPGLRPDLLRDERFLAGFFNHGASEDGGREEFDESAETWRFNSAIASACSRTIRSSSTTCARNCPTSPRSCSSVAASDTQPPCPTSPEDQPDTPIRVTPDSPATMAPAE